MQQQAREQLKVQEAVVAAAAEISGQVGAAAMLQT